MYRKDYDDYRSPMRGYSDRRSERMRGYNRYKDYDDYDEDEDMYEDDVQYMPRKASRSATRQGDGYGRRITRGRARRAYRFDRESIEDALYEIPSDIQKEDGEDWMMSLKNSDGTSGAHWTREQTDKVFNDNKVHEKSGGQITEDEFYYVMNMIYSDYSKALKDNNINSIQVYIALSMAFLNDVDAVENKLARYFYCITE